MWHYVLVTQRGKFPQLLFKRKTLPLCYPQIPALRLLIPVQNKCRILV